MSPRLPDEPRSLSEAATLNARFHKAARNRSCDFPSNSREGLRAVVDATHDAAKRLIASHLDPAYEPATVLDLSQLPKEERHVEAEDLAELADLVRLGVRTKADVERLLDRVRPLVEQNYVPPAA